MHETLDEILNVFTDWRLYVAVALVALPCLGYWLLRDGDGADAVGEQLGEAITAQRRITAEANDITERTNSLRTGISGAVRQTESINNNLTTAGEIIADCERILREVRARAEMETAAR